MKIPELDFVRPGVTLSDLVSQSGTQAPSSTREVKSLCTAVIQSWLLSKRGILESVALGDPVGSLDPDQKSKYPTEEMPLGNAAVKVFRLKHANNLDGSDLDPKYKGFIRDIVVDTSKRGQAWLFEQGVGAMFGVSAIEGVREMNDVQAFVEMVSNQSESKGLWAMTIGLIANAARSLASTKSTLSYADNHTRSLWIQLRNRTKQDSACVFNELAFLREAELPRPLSCELLLFLSNGGNGLVADYDRSQIQANFIKGVVDQGSHTEINVGVGAEHVSDIRWLLGNPDYDPRIGIQRALKLIPTQRG